MMYTSIPLVGYSDKFSVESGETLSFMISSVIEDVRSSIIRIGCADPNPYGPGYSEYPVDTDIVSSFEGKQKPIPLGSYAIGADSLSLRSFHASLNLYPTLLDREQTVLALGGDEGSKRATLYISNGGELIFEIGEERAVLKRRLKLRSWYTVNFGVDVDGALMWLRCSAIKPAANEILADFESVALVDNDINLCGPVNLGADVFYSGEGRFSRRNLNGKVEHLKIWAGQTERVDCLLLSWNFSGDEASDFVRDVSGNNRNGTLVNMPTRGVTGSSWDGTQLNFSSAPEQYAAVHFHDDDLYDCKWSSDIEWTIPEGLSSGIYSLKVEAGDYVDYVPFVVRPSKDATAATVAFVMSSYTYIAYANIVSPSFKEKSRGRIKEWNAYPWQPIDHREFGHSTYDTHSDGSGVCYSSRLRPNLFLRPRYLAATDQRGSGLRHFGADTYISEWLKHEGVEVDFLTDEDLEQNGSERLSKYRVVITGTHPEYHTPNSLTAYQDYVDGGGRLIYFGGNGFYWKIAVSDSFPGAIEIRRAEGGIRLWASDPGEYYNSLDATYGGMWRRNGRPPNLLTGVGFSSQGNFEGSYYKRTSSSNDPRAEFIFDGLEGVDILGDFGFFGGGAAGFELDRADVALGTPDHALVIAKSESHNNLYTGAHEELLKANPEGADASKIHADMTFFETASGGAVFSTGSITFAGSLPYLNYNNNIAMLMSNVLRRFIAEEEFKLPASYVPLS